MGERYALGVWLRHLRSVPLRRNLKVVPAIIEKIGYAIEKKPVQMLVVFGSKRGAQTHIFNSLLNG